MNDREITTNSLEHSFENISFESIRLTEISLNEDENGIQYLGQAKEKKIILANNFELFEMHTKSKFLPITMRKYILFQDIEAS